MEDNDGNNALIHICLTKEINYYAVNNINILIKNGININHQNHNGETALLCLLKLKCNIIHYYNIIKCLIKNGININLLDKNDNNAILILLSHKMELNCKLKLIKYLFKNGAEYPNVTTKNKHMWIISNNILDYIKKHNNNYLYHINTYIDNINTNNITTNNINDYHDNTIDISNNDLYKEIIKTLYYNDDMIMYDSNLYDELDTDDHIYDYL